jgi:hypothetical protein
VDGCTNDGDEDNETLEELLKIEVFDLGEEVFRSV